MDFRSLVPLELEPPDEFYHGNALLKNNWKVDEVHFQKTVSDPAPKDLARRLKG